MQKSESKNKYEMITNENADFLRRGVLDTIADVEGELAEVGVSIRDSAEVMCEVKGDRVLHLFDTFEGHPEGWIGKYDLTQTIGKHKADIEKVRDRLKEFPNVHFYKGIFPETADKIKSNKFCFVNLDTDLYKSTYEGLKFFRLLMVKGGMIVIHDVPGIPGVACAMVDYFEEYPLDKRNGSINIVDGLNQVWIYLNE